jgi:hypothetical protein
LPLLARPVILNFVSTLAEIQRAALDLPDDERAILIATLWESLPQVRFDDGTVERRLQDLANDPDSEISHDEFLREVQKERSSGR